MLPEEVPAGISRGTSGLELLLCLERLPLRRSIPGLLFAAGEAGIAEALRWQPSMLRRRLAELEGAERVTVDRDARLVYVRGSIENDPPANANVLKAWARCLADAPESPVLDEVRETIDRVVANGKLAGEWIELTGRSNGSMNSSPNGSINGSTNGFGNSRGTPSPSPSPVPLTEKPSPGPETGPVAVAVSATPPPDSQLAPRAVFDELMLANCRHLPKCRNQRDHWERSGHVRIPATG